MNKRVLLICIDGMRSEYLHHSSLKIPNIRKLLKEGSSVKRLETTFPSVTWCAHSSVITGCHPFKHNILGNRVFDSTNRCALNYFDIGIGLKDELIKIPTIYDVLYKNGYRIASICWPLTQGSQTIDYNIPEFYQQEFFEKHTTESFWEKLKAQGLPVHRYGPWSADHAKGPMQDWLTKEIVNYTVENEDADLIMAHYLLMDSFLHDYGNHTAEIYWAAEYIDSLVGETLSLLEQRNELDMAEIILFSDHGHADTSYTFFPNQLLFDEGLHFQSKGGKGTFVAICNGGSIFIYEVSRNEALLEKAEWIFRPLPYVNNIYTRNDFHKINFPFKTSGAVDYCPNMILELMPGYLSRESIGVKDIVDSAVVKSTHGYGPSFDNMDGFMVLKGPSFKKGKQLDRAGLIDIAPSLARIFSIVLDNLDGKPLLPLMGNIG